uniref:Uncharacterized protein n=1 Tax=viral metagenome TaxID=1070528 RepID=A0A6H1ZE13_9ZZZZ
MSWRVWATDVGADGDVVEGLATHTLFQSRWDALAWINRRVQSEGCVAPHYSIRADEAADAALENKADARREDRDERRKQSAGQG